MPRSSRNNPAEPLADAAGRCVRLCAGASLAYCSYAMCRSPVLPLFARQLGATPERVGMVVGASTVTGIFLKLPSGVLSDRLGRRTLIVAAALVFAAMPFTYLGVATLAGLLLLRLVHGSATAMFGPVASATLSDVAPSERRGAWLGSYSAIQGAGQALGPVAAGWLIQGARFDAVFVVSGALGLIALTMLAWGMKPHQPTAVPRQRTGWAQAIAAVGRDRQILATSLAQAGQMLLNGTLAGFLPLFAHERLGLSARDIGLVFGLQTAATLAARPAFGAWSDRVERPLLVVVGVVMSSVAVAAMSWAGAFSTLTCLAGLYGMGAGVTTAATAARITDLAHRARYGAAHGVFGTIYDIGDASGPILAGFLVATLGYEAMFRSMAIVVAAFAVMYALVGFGSRPAKDVEPYLARPSGSRSTE